MKLFKRCSFNAAIFVALFEFNFLILFRRVSVYDHSELTYSYLYN